MNPWMFFLELESELWNVNRTRLTLWLDPGRIKTDLIPNKEKGLPITQGNNYTIKINDAWRSANGITLDQPAIKTYYVTSSDKIKPSVTNWSIEVPKTGTKSELLIKFKESLDAILARERIHVLDQSNNRVYGKYDLMASERILKFVPDEEWKSGVYIVKAASELEDLAGNNLRHLFDVDTRNSIENQSETIQSIKFTIK